MLAAVFCVLFGLSLLPGRKCLCAKFAERISDGILPEGALEYCRRLTWFWFVFLALLTASNFVCFWCARGEPRWGWAIRLAPSVYALVLMPLVFFVEKLVRNRRFRVVFRTSGSTGKSKVIVKRFEMLAKEVAMHRRGLLSRFSREELDDSVFLGTVQRDHMLGKLWLDLLPKAAGVRSDDEVIMTPESLIAKMSAAKHVILITTPSFLDRFTRYASQYDVPRNCLEIVTSGALLTREVSDRVQKTFGLHPLQIFGSTEAGGVAWRRFPDEDFRVFDEVEVRSVDGRIGVKSPFSFCRDYVMGDGCVLAPDARSFRLLGRMDRLVKINEERVNLAEMEGKVRDLGFADCALAAVDGAYGKILGLVLAVREGERPKPLELRRLLLPVFPKGTVPRRFRFVSELPRNPQGKVLNAEIVRLLESVEVPLSFTGDERFFQGHFPGMPVLPGVVQLGLAVRHAQRGFAIERPVREVRKMKFVHVIEPRHDVTLAIERRGADEFAYVFREGDTVCSSGVLVF